MYCRGVGRSCEVVRPTGCVPALGIHVNRTCQETRYCACACDITFTQTFPNCTGKQCDINVAFNLYKNFQKYLFYARSWHKSHKHTVQGLVCHNLLCGYVGALDGLDVVVSLLCEGMF